MKDIIRSLNKNSIAEATGISYSRLRKYATGQVKSLRPDEIELIIMYLDTLIEDIKNDRSDS